MWLSMQLRLGNENNSVHGRPRQVVVSYTEVWLYVQHAELDGDNVDHLE